MSSVSSDVSQMPVLDGDELVGILDESDLLAAIEGLDAGRADRFGASVDTAMTRAVNTVEAGAPIWDLHPIFERGEVAVVMRKGQLCGLLTRVDLINHLRLAESQS